MSTNNSSDSETHCACCCLFVSIKVDISYFILILIDRSNSIRSRLRPFSLISKLLGGSFFLVYVDVRGISDDVDVGLVGRRVCKIVAIRNRDLFVCVCVCLHVHI